MARFITPALFAMALCLSFEAKSINYVTLNSGNWNDVTSVWSTNGGASPCGCNPGPVSGANNITVNHTISVPFDLTINGGTLTVNASGQINGAFNLRISNANVNISGYVTLDKYEQGVGSIVNLTSGAILLGSNSFLVADGTLTLDNALINSGALTVDVPGIVSLNNSSRFFVVSGNTNIDGQLNINSLSCTSSNGNFKIGPAGSVLGAGSLNSGGNLNNSGFVAPTIVWCAQGAGLGMPTPENCAGANEICNAILLPVELIAFDANDVGIAIEITWSTATERNNSHFLIQFSDDAEIWNDLEYIQGAGTTTNRTDYSILDNDFNFGVRYYRLIQFDLDGASTQYDPISVERKSVMNNSLTLLNLQNGLAQAQLLDNSGTAILSEELFVSSGNLQIIQEGNLQAIKIMVTE